MPYRHNQNRRHKFDKARFKKEQGDPIYILVNNTGLKICGSDEWPEPKYGTLKRKVWRKLHSAIDEGTDDIVASELTTNKKDDPSH